MRFSFNRFSFIRPGTSDRFWRWTVLAVAVCATAALWRMGDRQAQAERATFDASCCVAALDLNEVLSSLVERESREAELKSFIASKQSKLGGIEQQVQQVKKELEDMQKVLPGGAPEGEAKAEEFVRLQMMLEGETKLSKALIENKQKKMHLDLFNKIVDATRRFAEREGYQIVVSSDAAFRIPLQASEDQVQGAIVNRRIMYAGVGVEISGAVAQMMNNEFKAR